MNQQGTEFEGASIEASISPHPTVLQSAILKEIRSWAITLLGLGILSIFGSSFLSAPWGVMLILVGLASFYFRSSAMMVVYAVTLAWAGISNVTSGQVFWIGFAIFQWFLAIRVFLKFHRFLRAETISEEESKLNGLTPKRSAKIFPWAAGALGVFSLLGLMGIFVGVIILVAITRSQFVPGYVVFIEGLVVDFGVLGFAIGLASILTKHPRKAVAIIGMVTGIFTVVIEIGLRFL